MQQSIHGHAVLRMMLSADRPFSRRDLLAAIADRFGTDARFHTCSAERMTATELVGFLEARGKLLIVENGWLVDRSRICADTES
jgi:probable metal-binding protein